ncbi:MAG TPA: exodeoxyribonuclease VII small subunit [Pirellulaceae bacterium]|nr:exodeoxyribonuclease VII small subunit [Pirellulaceae bacterium]HMO90650.1 exodeoxyribonuclease VII small subunit [Pirellulaceae bacterium]HMP67771.1 exodeoxyribonuclease VII small subunit [Pirellulaceae bacterium]
MSKKKKGDEDVECQTLTFEDAVRRIEEIVTRLETGRLDLDQSLRGYEEGIQLVNQCHAILEQTEAKVLLLTGTDGEGKIKVEEFDTSASTLESSGRSRSTRRTQ